MDHDLLFETNKDKEWIIKVFDSLAPYGSDIDYNRQHKLQLVYGIVNNDITAITKYIRAMNDPTFGLFKADLPDEIGDNPVLYNRLFPKYEYHVNQIKSKKDNLEPVILDEGANKFKEDEYNQEISEFVQRQMLEIQNIQNLAAQGQITPQEAQSRIDELIAQEPPSYDNFSSTVEQFFKGIIDFFYFKYPVSQLKELLGRHLLCANDMYCGVIDNGFPEPVIFNPINVGFLKSNENPNVDSADYFKNYEYVTISYAYGEVLEYGTDEDLNKIKEYAGSYSAYSRPKEAWDITSGKARADWDYSPVAAARGLYGGRKSAAIGQNQGRRGNNFLEEDNYLKRTYLVFKAFDEVNILTYINEYGKTVIEYVDLGFEIPKDAKEEITTTPYGKSVKKKVWIDEFGLPRSIHKKVICRNYHGVRYDDLDIYLKYGEVPYQNFNPDSLPIKGKLMSSVNSDGVSLVERGIPGLAQIVYVKLLQNREMSKYKGVQELIDTSQIPDDLLYDEKGKPIIEGLDKMAVYEYWQKILGKSIADPTNSKLGLNNSTKAKASNFEMTQAFAEIINMQMFTDYLDREIGIQMLVPPQAEGTIQPYTTRGDNQDAQINAYIMASGYYDAVSEVLSKVIEEYIIQFVNYYTRYFEDNPDKTEVNLNYVMPDGTREILKIIPDYLKFSDIGVFIKNSGENEQYRKMMEQYTLQALSQNRGEGAEAMSAIMKSLARNESPEKIHKMIVVAQKQQQEKIQAQQKALEEIKLKVEQEKTRQKQEEYAHEKDIEHIRGDYGLQEKSMDVYKFQDDLNKDQDGIPDHIESLKALADIEKTKSETELNRKKAIEPNAVK